MSEVVDTYSVECRFITCGCRVGSWAVCPFRVLIVRNIAGTDVEGFFVKVLAGRVEFCVFECVDECMLVDFWVENVADDVFFIDSCMNR